MTRPQLLLQHAYLISLSSVLLACLFLGQESSATTGRVRRNTGYWNSYHHYKYWKYKAPKVKPKLPKGQCNVTASINLNGTDPIRAEAALGNTVLVYMSKTTDKQHFSLWQLPALNQLARWYRHLTKQKVSFLVINHARTTIPYKAFTSFPFLKFYQEPKGKPSVIKKLNGRYRDVFVYDKCGRQQYRIGYPYSSLRYQFVKNAVHNTMHFYEGRNFCGPCKPAEPFNPGDDENLPAAESDVDENGNIIERPPPGVNPAGG